MPAAGSGSSAAYKGTPGQQAVGIGGASRTDAGYGSTNAVPCSAMMTIAIPQAASLAVGTSAAGAVQAGIPVTVHRAQPTIGIRSTAAAGGPPSIGIISVHAPTSTGAVNQILPRGSGSGLPGRSHEATTSTGSSGEAHRPALHLAESVTGIAETPPGHTRPHTLHTASNALSGPSSASLSTVGTPSKLNRRSAFSSPVAGGSARDAGFAGHSHGSRDDAEKHPASSGTGSGLVAPLKTTAATSSTAYTSSGAHSARAQAQAHPHFVASVDAPSSIASVDSSSSSSLSMSMSVHSGSSKFEDRSLHDAQLSTPAASSTTHHRSRLAASGAAFMGSQSQVDSGSAAPSPSSSVALSGSTGPPSLSKSLSTTGSGRIGGGGGGGGSAITARPGTSAATSSGLGLHSGLRDLAALEFNPALTVAAIGRNASSRLLPPATTTTPSYGSATGTGSSMTGSVSASAHSTASASSATSVAPRRPISGVAAAGMMLISSPMGASTSAEETPSSTSARHRAPALPRVASLKR